MHVSMTFDTRQLSRDLFSRSFRFETQWMVVTGAPCSGKTTVLEKLEKYGIRWVPEMARVCIESALEMGLTVAQIRKDEAAFQRQVTAKKLMVEEGTPTNQLVFFDRGLPDSITYYRVAGIDPNEALSQCFMHRYKRVFLLDRLNLENDEVRVEDERTAGFIHSWLENDYKALGYDVINVPVLPLEERAMFLLDNIG